MRFARPLLLLGALLASGCSTFSPAALAPEPSGRAAVATTDAPSVLLRNPMARRKLFVSKVESERRAAPRELAVRPLDLDPPRRAAQADSLRGAAARALPAVVDSAQSSVLPLKPPVFNSPRWAMVRPVPALADSPGRLAPTSRHLPVGEILRRLDALHERTAAELRRTNSPELVRLVEQGRAEQERVRARGRKLLMHRPLA